MSAPNRKVAVVTDSAAALTREQIVEHELFVPRMEITIDGNTLIDGANAELSDFYTRLATSTGAIPTTSAPKPAEYLEKFRSAAGLADNVFCVSVSAKLSAAYDAARVGAELFSKEQSSAEVRIFDSETAASSQALIVLAAARCAEAGCSLDEVEAAANHVAEKVRLLAMLDTLRFIHRSGRVPKIAVWATSALNIKPVMEYSTNRIGAIARPRSAERAIGRIQSEMLDDLQGKTAHVNVMHAGAPERAEILRSWVSENLDYVELFVTQFHPFMGAHTGPGLVGASWWAE
jgi:DegV family protein with EDD domain